METVAIQFDFVSHDVESGLSVDVNFNGEHIQTLNRSQTVQLAVDCKPGEHVLEFVLKNKTSAHTVLNNNNEIIRDACVSIENFQIDHVALEHTFFEQCRYYHDFNGSQDAIDDDFFGIMGCNGTVSLRFTSPVYRWLVDTM